FRIVRHTVRDQQSWCGMRFTLELLVEHIEMVLVNVRIADEVGKPARRITGQAAYQMQERGAFRQVEGRAQADVIAADIEAQRNFPGGRVGNELVKKMVMFCTEKSEEHYSQTISSMETSINKGTSALSGKVPRYHSCPR